MSIGGVRVNSRRESMPPVYKYQRVINSKATERTRILAQHIPFWPNVIKVKDLARETGFTRAQVEMRISSCHGDYLIFTTENGAVSRLKEDLSNV